MPIASAHHNKDDVDSLSHLKTLNNPLKNNNSANKNDGNGFNNLKSNLKLTSQSGSNGSDQEAGTHIQSKS